MKSIQFLDQTQELIDQVRNSFKTFCYKINWFIKKVWIEGREPKGETKITIHDVKDAGKSWDQKINEVIARMQAIKADIFVVSALDEVACK